MANADDLKRLAEEMVGAYEARVSVISDIKQETANLLGAFGKSREEMAKELRAELAKVKPDLEATESERRAVDQAEIKERTGYIAGLLDDYDKAHQEMSDNLRAELAKVKPDLDAAEGKRKKEDQAEVKQRSIDIENLLSDFDKTHAEMTKELRAELARIKPEIQATESERKAADQAEIKQRSIDIENLLADFDKAHAEMTKELRAELARVKPGIQATESERKATDQAKISERDKYIEELLSDFDKAHAKMSAELRAELAKVKPELEAAESERKAKDQAEIRETAAAWKGLLSAIQTARGGTVVAGPVEVEAAVEVKTVEETIEEPAEEATIEEPAEEAAVEEPVEEAEPEMEKAEQEDLGGRILDLIEDNPEGLKMTQIADMLGIENWRSLIPAMRELMDDGEIKKEDTQYFPAE